MALILEKHKMPVQDPEVRAHNFEEVALGYDEETAVAEAERCLHCKVPQCRKGCPVSIDIPTFIGKIKERDFDGAIATIKESNALPAICGRVCPQENQCEKHCILAKRGESVAIGRLERFVADWHNANVQEAPAKPTPNGHKVAVIGSGPSGLTCAGDLAKKGYDVTVFEALHLAGGVLVYGIPEFRLPKAIVANEVAKLKAQGVTVMTDMVIGMKVDDALKITNADIAKALDGLPREKMHCSVMGQEALEAAIRQWKGEPAMPRTQEEGKLVCKCFNVTDQTIIRAIRENHLKTVDDVTAFTKAGGGCGECRDEIAEILEAELKREGETIEQPVKKPAEEKPAGLSNLQRMQKVMEVINMIRPQLQADGGDIELVDIKVVSVRLQGSCHGCAASQVTLHQVIEQILRQQVEPDIVIEEAQK